MTSAALTKMAARLDEVIVLSATDPRINDPRSSNATLSGAVNRACVVLLSAHLEGYLEDVALEALDVFITEAICVDDLPLLLRAVHAEDHLGVLEQMKDRKARAPRIQDLLQSELGLWQPGNRLATPMLRASTLSKQMSNPGSREMRSFLELVGVDLKDWLQRTSDMPLLGDADGLVARRNAIAHGEVSASVTSADVSRYIISVETLSRSIDEAVAERLMQICSLHVRPW